MPPSRRMRWATRLETDATVREAIYGADADADTEA